MSTAPPTPDEPDPLEPEYESAEPLESAEPYESAEPLESTSRDEVRVRRAPKYPVFIFGGIGVGIVATFIAVSVAPGAATDPFAQVFGYFVLYGIALGALFGAVVAVIFDAIATRRAKSVETEKTSAVLPPQADEPVDGELE